MSRSASFPEQLLGQLCEVVGQAAVITGREAEGYERGARYGIGKCACVVRPATAEEVARVVKLCVQAGVSLVPQGANTGLVGASTPDLAGAMVILSLNRLKGTVSVDVANRHVTASAGVLLHELNDRLQQDDLFFPIDLGADPSVGGMVATNTGGTRLIRYGDVRHNLLSVEVVLFDPPGEIVRFGRPLQKDNTGFDFKQLFVGASGSTGIVTEATLRTHRLPRQAATALIVPVSDSAVLSILLELENQFGDFLAAFEGISGTALRAAIEHVEGLHNPFDPDPVPDFAVLVELQSVSTRESCGLDLNAALEAFLESKFGETVATAVLGRGDELWRIRHSISEGARALGRPIAFDISIPRSRMMEFRQRAATLVNAVSPGTVVVDFGHIADGGLHFNLALQTGTREVASESLLERLRDQVYDLAVREFGGSFSAEHGIGPHNLAYYHRYTPPAQTLLAGRVLQLLDPRSLCGTVRLGPALSEPASH